MGERKMKNGFIWKTVIITIAIVAAIGGMAVLSVMETEQTDGNNKGIIPLKIPSFISMTEASGATNPSGDASFLEDEAGISAYTNVGKELDLEVARNAFRTIEYETNEYIVGSVNLTGYSETEDVHCYLQRNGWILTYYFKHEPVSKILDWANYHTDEKIKGTKLEIGITKVCTAANITKGDIMYYDFEYPNADNLMIIADSQWVSGTDRFNVTLPSDFTFYELSYSHYSRDSHGSKMKIDEEQISSLGVSDYTQTNYGLLTYEQLLPDVAHAISIQHYEYSSVISSYSGEAFGAIALLYHEG